MNSHLLDISEEFPNYYICSFGMILTIININFSFFIVEFQEYVLNHFL